MRFPENIRTFIKLSDSVKGSLIRILTFISVFLINPCLTSYGYNMRQTFSGDGLSNSAILSLCCDSDGYLWIGTCDGVNIADGISIYPFQSLYAGQSLSGNIIENASKDLSLDAYDKD